MELEYYKCEHCGYEYVNNGKTKYFELAEIYNNGETFYCPECKKENPVGLPKMGKRYDKEFKN